MIMVMVRFMIMTTKVVFGYKPCPHFNDEVLQARNPLEEQKAFYKKMKD